MILHDLRFIAEEGPRQIGIHGGHIEFISDSSEIHKHKNKEPVINFDGALALPGFINSHDHLEFNIFPRLGNGTYPSYREWGPFIQKEYKDIIEQVQLVPLTLRIQWGLYKNLLNGFTTVVNHGPHLRIDDPHINVFQDSHTLHSPGFEKFWQWKLNSFARRNKPIVMHMGEGTDPLSKTEIDRVIRMNFFKRKIVAVHGVAMTAEQAPHFAGLIWCPSSNYFLLDKTAELDKLKNKIPILFGTDSTLTASWNAWEHFRLALNSGLISNGELLLALTKTPARVWNFHHSGELQQGFHADLLIVKNTAPLFKLGPEDILMVMRSGKIQLADERIYQQVKTHLHGFTRIRLHNSTKWVVGNVHAIADTIKKLFPSAHIPFQ